MRANHVLKTGVQGHGELKHVDGQGQQIILIRFKLGELVDMFDSQLISSTDQIGKQHHQIDNGWLDT